MELDGLGGRPEQHRTAIGRRLIEHVEQHALTPETQLLHMKTLAPTHTDENYAKTRAFWQALGFIPMDSHLLWGEENPCLVMVKPITGR